MLRQGCSLSMPHRTCGVRLGWLSMPNIMCMPFILNPGVLRRTLSNIWCKLNLSIFLISVGLLTLMYIDSLIVLAMSWSSLPIIWKLSWMVVWHVLLLWLCIGESSFMYSLILSRKVLEVSPMYSSSHARSLTLEPVDGPLLFSMGSLSLGETRRFLIAILPLMWVCMPYLSQILNYFLH